MWRRSDDDAESRRRTAPDGTFSIKGLPPGTYTIEAWHEKLGTQTQTVTAGAKQSKEIALTPTIQTTSTTCDRAV